MENPNFIPQWYAENKIKRKFRKVCIYTIFLIFINVIAVYKYKTYLNRVKDYKIAMLNDNLSKEELTKEKVPTKNTTSYEAYNEISKLLINDLNFKQISIKENQCTLDIIVSNVNEYYNVVKKIEGQQKFKISNVSSLISSEGFFTFKVIMEVVK